MSSSPLPLFDNIHYFQKSRLSSTQYPGFVQQDYEYAKQFLSCYTGSQGTFNAYRREVERLLQWTFSIKNSELNQLKREQIEEFLYFCQAPPTSWIGLKKAPRFYLEHGERLPNPEWRPFVVTVSKAQHRLGVSPQIQNFQLSQSAIKETFAILSSFFNYLTQEEYLYHNPVSLIRQKSQFLRRYQGPQQIRRLTDMQWQTILSVTERLASEKPDKYERSRFILTALYAMYLRISELCANERWQPSMKDFYRDGEGNWWFITIGKGNKQRQIAVSDAMLEALKRWRTHLTLPPLPSPNDHSPLLPKQKGKGPITSTTYLREIVQFSFDEAILELRLKGCIEEADSLLEATVHWLRHTGISEDVKHRPREHVRDDAGHGSSATTDKYIDIHLKERHQSARHKRIREDEGTK